MPMPQNQLKMISQLKTELTYSKLEHLLSNYYEGQLEKEVSRLFQKMEYQIIENLVEYYNPEVMFQANIDLILAPIQELHKEYYEILCKYKIREFDKGRASGKRIVEKLIKFRRKGNVVKKRFSILNTESSFKADIKDVVSSSISKDNLFGTSPIAHENLETRTYQLSEKTLSRVDNQINDIITKGYDKGEGINVVSNDIRKRFGQLETWESKRIARTEIHNSQTLGIIQGYNDMGVEYLQWSSARDARVRGLHPRDKADHYHLDGEIIPMGGVFSNGLMYPGDMSGPAHEIINCRCSALPYILPYGYIAPPEMAQFRETDLIPTLDAFNKDELISRALSQTEPIQTELTDAQILEKLNTMDLETKLDELEKVLDWGAVEEWIKLTEKLERIDNRIVANDGFIPKGMQKAKEKLLTELYAYEKAIFKPPKPIPKINIKSYAVDNQTVGSARTIKDTILEKKQIELQEKIIFPPNEFNSVRAYGGVNHAKINGYIRKNEDWSSYLSTMLTKGHSKKEMIKEVETLIKDIDDAMQRTPALQQDSTIFRACDTFGAYLRKGDIDSFKGYASCSFQMESAEGFDDTGRYMLKILAPKGQKGIAMNAKNNGDKITYFTHEHEFLLPKNQKFQVIEVDHKSKTATILLI